jgi:hypothetical protein
MKKAGYFLLVAFFLFYVNFVSAQTTLNYLQAWDYTGGSFALWDGTCAYRGDNLVYIMQFGTGGSPNQAIDQAMTQDAYGGNPRIWAGTYQAVQGGTWDLSGANGWVTQYTSDYWYTYWTIPYTAPFDHTGVEYAVWQAKDPYGQLVTGFSSIGYYFICCSEANHACATGQDCCSGNCYGSRCVGGHTEVACFGDSITQASDVPARLGYCALLDGTGLYSTHNYGIGG